jgi:hypothetical protein
MRPDAFLLPERFGPHALQFRVRAATGSDSGRARVASLRTAHIRGEWRLQIAKLSTALVPFAKDRLTSTVDGLSDPTPTERFKSAPLAPKGHGDKGAPNLYGKLACALPSRVSPCS